MTVRAHFDLQILTQRRAGEERVAAATRHRRVFIFGMDSGLHDDSRAPHGRRLEKKGAQCSHGMGQPQQENDPITRAFVADEGSHLAVRNLSTKPVDKCVDSRVRRQAS